MTLITLFGRPGAGKSTVGDRLAAQHGFVHLALGAMLKDPQILEEIGIDPLEMEQAIASGRTVKSTKLYPWVDARIRSCAAVVVDGYPRATVSAAPFTELVESLPPDRDVFALLITCPTEITHARLNQRGRADDDERIASRDDEFERIQAPLIATLPARVKVVEIDGSREASEVFANVERALGLLTRVGID